MDREHRGGQLQQEIDAWIGGEQRDQGGAQASSDPRLTFEASLCKC